MESGDQNLAACLKGLSHLEELRDCLALEREKLISLDLEGLWRLAEIKQEILREAEKSGDALRSLSGRRHLRDASEIVAGSPDAREDLGALSKKMTRLKEEIRARTAENMSIIRDSLGFVEDLLSILTQGVKQESSYGKPLPSGRRSQPLMVSREV